MRTLAIAILFGAVAFAQNGHGPYYGKPNTRCWRGETATHGAQTRVHCGCKLQCQGDMQVEDSQCQTYCTHDDKPENQQCLCHLDEACH